MRWHWWRFPTVGRRSRTKLPAIATPRTLSEPVSAADAEPSAAPPLPVPPPDDLQALQEELQRFLKLEPAAVEPYLALADYYRANGEPHKAMAIRQRLALRPALDKGQRARLHYEFGRDQMRAKEYAKALKSFDIAHLLLPRNQAVRLAIAECALYLNTPKDAARLFAESGRKDLQAHALARHAQIMLNAGNVLQARRVASKAAAIANHCPEGWLVLIREATLTQNWKRLARQLRNAMHLVPAALQFVLWDAILYPEEPWFPEAGNASSRPCNIGPACVSDRVQPAVNPLRARADVAQAFMLEQSGDAPETALLCYYTAALCQAGGAIEAAQRWLERSIALEPASWRARMDLTALRLPKQETDAPFADGVKALWSVLSAHDRFVCVACGLTRDSLFFHCPRCSSWRRIAFRFA